MQKKIEEYRIIDVNEKNVDEYGLFCLQSKKKEEGYKKKLYWIRKRFGEGLRYKMLLVNEGEKRGLRARGFIEYMPGQCCWRGIHASGYMVIHCLWVVGKNRGKGYGTKLLRHCLKDARGMKGVAVVTGRTWLPGKSLFLRNGFKKADEAPPHFELYVKRFSEDGRLPRFRKTPKDDFKKYDSCLTILKSNQCPYLEKAALLVQGIAREKGIEARLIEISDSDQAHCTPYGVFGIFLGSRMLSYHVMGKKDLLTSLQ